MYLENIVKEYWKTVKSEMGHKGNEKKQVTLSTGIQICQKIKINFLEEKKIFAANSQVSTQ